MSVSDKEIFNVGASGGGIHVREDDGTQQREDRYVSGGGCTRDFAKAKQLILHALTKAEKQLLRRRNKKISSSSASANAGTSAMFHVCCKIIRLQTGDAPCSNGGEPSLIHPIVILVKNFGCKFSFLL
ncbi:uncharacterized protein LOC132188255 isoform X2 [Corylus avellana]|uniref:uncharacterized protein LOC132188255 isoform X2 n=1 Tax=Corylus avellana TaxID=13451 RepID=UPI00286C37A9|nr:uncharacterized protein LOC132188255 isoform X2 [Corylus avellana]